MPDRIQRRRTKGWRMPEGAVYVGRGSRWGNPFYIEWFGTSASVIADTWSARSPFNRSGHLKFHGWRIADIQSAESMTVEDQAQRWSADTYRHALEGGYLTVTVDDVHCELAGHDLACWCPLDHLCHADILLAIANQEATHG